jgi:hypothetical protein
MAKTLTQYITSMLSSGDIKTKFILTVGNYTVNNYLLSWQISYNKEFGAAQATFILNNSNGIFGENGTYKINVGDVVSFSEYFGTDNTEFKKFYGIVSQRSIAKSATERKITLLCLDYISTLEHLDINLDSEGSKIAVEEEVLTPNFLPEPNDSLSHVFNFANNNIAQNPSPILSIRNQNNFVEDPQYDGFEIQYENGQVKLGFPLNAKDNYDLVAVKYYFYVKGKYAEDVIEEILTQPDGYGNYMFGESSAQAVIDNHLTDTFTNITGNSVDYMIPNYTSTTITIETTLAADFTEGNDYVYVNSTEGLPEQGEGKINGDTFTWSSIGSGNTLTGIPTSGSYALKNHKAGSYVKYEATYPAGQVWYLSYNNLTGDFGDFSFYKRFDNYSLKPDFSLNKDTIITYSKTGTNSFVYSIDENGKMYTTTSSGIPRIVYGTWAATGFLPYTVPGFLIEESRINYVYNSLLSLDGNSDGAPDSWNLTTPYVTGTWTKTNVVTTPSQTITDLIDYVGAGYFRMTYTGISTDGSSKSLGYSFGSTPAWSIVNGEKYTVSFWAKGSVSGCSLSIGAVDVGEGGGSTWMGSPTSSCTILEDTWRRFSITTTATDRTANITSIEDIGSGKCKIYASNSFSTGCTVWIENTTNYNGSYTIANQTSSSFEITAAFAGTETGLARRKVRTVSGRFTVSGIGEGDTLDVSLALIQLEKGTGATSFIPNLNVSAGVERSADILSITNSEIRGNSKESIFIECTPSIALTNDATVRYLLTDDFKGRNISKTSTGTVLSFYPNYSESPTASANFSPMTVGTKYILGAISDSSSPYVSTYTGATLSNTYTTAPFTAYSDPTGKFYIGSNTDGSSSFNGVIHGVAIYTNNKKDYVSNINTDFSNYSLLRYYGYFNISPVNESIKYIDNKYGRIILESPVSLSSITICLTDYSFKTLQATGIEINRIQFRTREVANRLEAVKKVKEYLAPNYVIRTKGDDKIWANYLTQKTVEDYTLQLSTNLNYLEDEDLYTRVLMFGKNKNPTNLMLGGNVSFVSTGEPYKGIATAIQLVPLREEGNYYVYGVTLTQNNGSGAETKLTSEYEYSGDPLTSPTVLYVASTSGFDSTGTAYIENTNSTWTEFTYSGVTDTTFTGVSSIVKNYSIGTRILPVITSSVTNADSIIGRITANSIKPIVYVNEIAIDNQSHIISGQQVIVETTTRTDTTTSGGGK